MGMRSDVIAEILSVEDNAQKLEKDAQTQSHDMIAEAQADANTYVHDTVQAHRASNRNLLEKAEEDSQKAVDDYAATLDSGSRLDESEVNAMADAIIKKICETQLFGAAS